MGNGPSEYRPREFPPEPFPELPEANFPVIPVPTPVWRDPATGELTHKDPSLIAELSMEDVKKELEETGGDIQDLVKKVVLQLRESAMVEIRRGKE